MYTRIAQLRTPDQFSEYIYTLGIELTFDSDLQTTPKSPFAQPFCGRQTLSRVSWS